MDFFEYASMADIFAPTKLWVQLLIGGLCFAIVFIFEAIGLYTIAVRNGYKNKWMAFIPFFNTYYIGVCAQKNKFYNVNTKTIGLIAAITEAVLVFLYIFALISGSLVDKYLEKVTETHWLFGEYETYTLNIGAVPDNLQWAAWVYRYMSTYILSILDLVFNIMQIILLICFFQTYAVKNFKPNMMYVGNIDGGGFYDLGMCVYFKAPKSFTGEDVVEFHCHGGVELTRSIFRQTLKFGARSADKGEFTKRAFINGKLSLSSAEGMIDMINAESSASLRAGSMLYGEKLTREIKSVQSELTDVLAKIAVDIDYPDEADETSALNIETDIKNISDKLKKLSSQYSSGKKIKDGVTVAIFGKPNTGKSSLLNALLGYDKAIVSSEAGTTRDAVEGEIIIDGVKFNLIDTAGRACSYPRFPLRNSKNFLPV